MFLIQKNEKMLDQNILFLTWTGPGPLAECHVSKLVLKVFRIKVFRVKVVRINEILLAVDDSLDEDMNNPALRNNNVGVRDLVILGADSLVGCEQHLVSAIYSRKVMHQQFLI